LGSVVSQPILVVRSRRVVTARGVEAAAVHVAGGRIAAVGPFDDLPTGCELVEAGEAALLPGAVDTHVHVDEPGRTEWEGFASAGRAAAAGGVTTLVDMPLNSIPATTSVAALEAKRAAAAGRSTVDVGFWGGVVPANRDALEPLWQAGVLGFKAFLAPSGVPEFGHVEEADLRAALPVLARLGAPLLVHAELPAALVPPRPGADPRRHTTWLETRPPAAEAEAVRLLLRLASEHGARLHVVHVAADSVLPLLAEARAAGLAVTAETCPHYLTFAAEEIPDGATELKCAPPIRTAAHREALWRGLSAGVLDLVASDHSPSPPELKRRASGDFLAAWGGIASLQVALAVLWTEARRRGHGLEDLARWTAAAPARLAGLAGRKGSIAPGLDADVVLFDPEATFVVEGKRLEHRHPLTPYEGRRLLGGVRRTYVRGRLVYDSGTFPAAPRGELLAR
jgi:allantoinase